MAKINSAKENKSTSPNKGVRSTNRDVPSLVVDSIIQTNQIMVQFHHDPLDQIVIQFYHNL